MRVPKTKTKNENPCQLLLHKLNAV